MADCAATIHIPADNALLTHSPQHGRVVSPLKCVETRNLNANIKTQDLGDSGPEEEDGVRYRTGRNTHNHWNRTQTHGISETPARFVDKRPLAGSGAAAAQEHHRFEIRADGLTFIKTCNTWNDDTHFSTKREEERPVGRLRWCCSQGAKSLLF